MPAKKKKARYIILAVAAAACLGCLFLPNFLIEKLTITYPYHGAMFPPDIAPPTIKWADNLSGANVWRIRFDLDDSAGPIISQSDFPEWTPEREVWETVKRRSINKNVTISIQGYKKSLVDRILTRNKALSKNSVTISTSSDSVNAPIFYRDVPLPFDFAREKMELIQWRLGDISKNERPPVVLEGLPVCGNCHSFSPDGKTMAMDVDNGGDKGAFMIAPVEEDIYITPDKLMSWTDFKRDDGMTTFGLLAQISPDSRYVVCSVKDKVIFLARNNLLFSQLFFPVKGIIAIYNRENKKIFALPGADDPEYVQANPMWTPDGKYIVFARSNVHPLMKNDRTKGSVLTRGQSAIVLGGERYIQDSTGGERFTFDLYKIPFNDGKGGVAEPIKGASQNGMSNYFAKYSPDRKWIVFCRARSFMLLQPDSKLYIMPADCSKEPRLMNCNTNRLNSWHSWSPNSRWLVFSSKVNSAYTELFLTHIDENGNDTPPVLISSFSSTERARNIPEFVNIKLDGIKQIHENFVDYYSYYSKAIKMYYLEKWEYAELACRQSIELNPDYQKSHCKLALTLVQMNRYDEAEKEFLISLKLNPKDPVAHMNYGTLLSRTNRVEKAFEHFKKAIEYDPWDPAPYHNLGIIYLNMKEYDKAKELFDKSVKCDVSYSPAYNGLGVILLAQGDVKGATEKFIASYRNDPRESDPLHYLGRIYTEAKEYDKAEKAFKNIILYHTKDVEAYVRLGTVYFLKNEYDKAEREYMTALNLEPENLGALQNLGILYAAREMYDKAEHFFISAYRKDQQNASVCFMLAKVLSRNERSLNDAIGMYNRALALDPAHIQGYMELANLYMSLGNRNEAVHVLERALERNPQAQSLKNQLDTLKRQI